MLKTDRIKNKKGSCTTIILAMGGGLVATPLADMEGNMKSGRIHLTFPDTKPIDAADIADYLFLIRGAYTAALSISSNLSVKQTLSSSDDLIPKLENKLSKLNVTQINSLFTRPLGNKTPVTISITHKSPLEIILFGSLVALVLAVILSGGKIKFSALVATIEAELPPIGKGIKKLRYSLSKAPKSSVGFVVKSKTVKLNMDEFHELMKYDPSTRKRGGFQRLLIGMQVRINRITYELDLSQHDIDMILKHGRTPGKGGWQSSIKKIFGRHFYLSVPANKQINRTPLSIRHLKRS